MQQAQLATYVGEKVTHLPDSNYIMRHLGTIMLANQGTITRTVKHHENVLDESGQASTTLTRGEERKVLSMAEYADYVQSVGGQDYEPIRGRAQILGVKSPTKALKMCGISLVSEVTYRGIIRLYLA